MKHLVIKVFTIIIASFVFMFIDSCNVKAYTVLEYYSYNNRSTINPTFNNNIQNVSSNWSISGATIPVLDPWLTSIGTYFYAGSVSGTYLNINADYYLGMKGELYNDANISNYLNNPLNTLTTQNLRCGIGDYRTGYYTQSLPEISDFRVTYTNNLSSTTGPQFLWHVTFRYKQYIGTVNKQNTNISCWFERSPSNGLFAQSTGLNSSSRHYFYSDSAVNWSVSNDPNTVLLTTITEQNTIINNNINGIKDSINDSSVDNVSDKFDTINSFLPENGVITQLITLPVILYQNVLSSINGTCSSINLGSLFGTSLILPCINPSDFLGVALWNIIDGLCCLFFIFTISKKFISAFDNFSGLKEGDILD